jgi:pterin-4a-carbinolamine dehydratase
MELTYKLKDETTQTERWELSADGKTLTQTVTFTGVSKPEIDVYDRQ